MQTGKRSVRHSGSVLPACRPERTVRSEAVEAVFADGRVWQAEDTAEHLLAPRMQTLEEAYGDEEMADQFRIRFGDDCRYLPWEGEAIWYCTCGTVNAAAEARCRRCRRVRKALTRVNTAELRKETDRRRDREKHSEEETDGKKKIRISPWAVIPAAVIVMAAMAFLLFGSGKIMQRWENAAAAPSEAVERPRRGRKKPCL